MNTTLSPTIRRALALAILVGIVWLVVFNLVIPLVGALGAAQDAERELAQATERKADADQRVAALTAELQQLKAQKASATGFLEGDNEALATAQLQDRLRKAVDTAHGDLRSTTAQPPHDEGAYRRISIRGQIAVTVGALQQVFYDFEAGSPYLFLDNVEIRAQPIVRGRRPPQGAPPPETTEDPVLDVRFDLYGYLRRPS